MTVDPANVNVALLSIVAVVPALIVNALFDVSPAPVYIKVPLPNTKLVLALVAAHKLPEVLPPLPIVPTLNVPALIVTTPVCKFVPVKINIPEPVLVRFPVVAAADPLTVKVLVVISKVPVVPAVIVKFLSVEAVEPVYCKVPPPNTKLDAELVACPKFPATPPFPIVPTLNVPALIVVTPV